MPQNNDPKARRKELYQGLTQSGDYTDTFDQFEKDYSNPESIEKVLYSGLKETGDINDGTTAEQFSEHYFGDIVKKKIPGFTDQFLPRTDGLSQHIGETSAQRLSEENARIAANQSNLLDGINGISSQQVADQIQKSRKDASAKTKLQKEENRQKLNDFYDKTEEILPTLGTPEQATKQLYKNYLAENGGLDRYNYLEEKAKVKREGNIKTYNELQTAIMKADEEGNTELSTKLKEMAKVGAETIASGSDTDLQLWEEASTFRFNLLNNKIDELVKDPETKAKLQKLESLKQQLDVTPGDNALVTQYNDILADPQISKINNIAKQGDELMTIEKETAKKFPKQFAERVERKSQQAQIDRMFETGDKGIASGIKNQLGRSATNFIGDFFKIPSLVDFDNSYGTLDLGADFVDMVVDHVDRNYLPIPTKYSSPLIYNDEKGNSVIRYDLLAPKVAKLGGDMATLLFGASKLSTLGKAAGMSTKVSEGIGLFTSSYVQTFDDYKKEAIAAGMSPKDAAIFASTSAAATSALELMSPQKFLWSKADLTKSAVEAVAKGTTKKQATKLAFKEAIKGIPAENLQEMFQMGYDKVIEAGANKVLDNDYFEHNTDDLINESLETLALTSIVSAAGGIGAVGVSGLRKENSHYNDAIKLMAENKDKYLPLLQQAFKNSKISPERAMEIMKDIDSVNVPQAGAPLYMINDVPVSKDEIIKKIKANDLAGVYVANDPTLESVLKNPETFAPAPKVKVAEEKVGENGEKEKPEDKARRVAQAQIRELVKSGDVSWDGKRANALTEKGKVQMGLVMDELRRATNVKYKVVPSKGKEVGEHNGVKIYETTNVKAYREGIQKAVGNRPDDGIQVDVKSEEDLQEIVDKGGKLFLSEDENFGAYVMHNGYMGGLFKNRAAKTSGVAKTLQDLRVKSGGKYFDAFGTKLEDIYIKNGFRPVARLPFNEEFAPKGWQNTDLKNKPDVVFFAYDPKGEYKKGDGVPLQNWEEAFNLTQKFVSQNETNTAGARATTERSGGSTVHEAHVVDGKNVPPISGESKTAGGSSQASTGSQTGIQIEGSNLDLQALSKSAKDPETKRIATILTKAKSTLSAVVPGLRIAVYNGEEQGNQLLAKLGSKSTAAGARGFYDHGSKTIGIDLSQADATTAFHEVIHPIVDALKANNPEAFKALAFEAGEFEMELENGSKQKYRDYAKGNQEEALIEFLADYADGKFDKFNQSSIIKQVKNLINKVLAAVGLKPSDIKLNLNKPQSLKDFADTLASAISQGKTLNVSAVNERVAPTRFQQAGPKKKLNRTAEKIAYDKQTQYKNLQADIVQNPQDYSYVQQDLNKKKQDLSNMTLDELVNEQTADQLLTSINQNNQYAVISALELLRRKNANNEDTRPIFKKLREIGTGVGQLLRQFAEFKHRSAEGIVSTVLGNLESMNMTLTDEQIKTLTNIAKDNFVASNEHEAKRVAVTQDPNQQNVDALKAAEKKLEDSFHELNKFVGQVTPMGVDSMIATILQGNLLTTKSIVVNVASNIIQQPIRLAELVAGDIATYMVNRYKGLPAINPLELYYSATLNGIQGFMKGSSQALKDIATGKGAENAATLEVRRNLKPLQALQQIFTKAGRATLPVNSKGKVPLSVYIEKALEGTSGWPAEAMFRMLYLGDKPFKEAARHAASYRMFSETGGKGNAEYQKFMANLTAKQNKQLQELSEEATFSNDRTVAKAADKFVNMVNKSVEVLAETAPNETVQHALKVFGRVLAKANTPFVRVPANLLQNLLEWAIPVLPLYGAMKYAKQGDTHKASALVVRSAIGFSLYYMANMMYDAGVILASGEGDDDDERQLKYEVGKPNGINIDALSRFIAGTHDPNNLWKPGDTVVDFQKMGLVGMFMAYNAELNEYIKKELGKPRSELSMISLLPEAIGSISRTALEMSFLQGSYVAIDALRNGDFSNYLADLGTTMSALIIPNQVAVTTRARAEYMLKADDKETVNKFLEKQSTRLFPSMKDQMTGVYPIISMFGEPVKQNPEKGTFGDTNPIIYQFLDITNGKQIDDAVALEVFNLSKRVGEVPFSAPTPKVKLEDKTYNLTERDYVYMQQIAGKYKRIDLIYEMSQPEWKEMSDEDKTVVMEDINQTANADARDHIVDMLYNGIDTGSVILEDGKYTYKTPEQFDFDYAKKAVEPEP